MKFRQSWMAVALLAGACATNPRADSAPGTSPGQKSAPKQCVDRDHDGFGEACSAGADCDDQDPAVHNGCKHCAQPDDGCGCARGTRPVACFLDKTQDKDGTVMCHEGTRYCRDGRWSSCESVYSYPLPE